MNVFRVGTTQPGAVLLDALDHYQSKSTHTVELLEVLMKEDQLTTAIEACLDAAKHAWDPKVQRQLLSAVQFGRTWIGKNTKIRDKAMEVSHVLRVLNAMRQPDIAMPLSYGHLTKITYSGVIKLLLSGRHHLLAFQIARFLRMNDNYEEIVFDWAKLKIQNSRDIEVDRLVEAISDRLSEACQDDRRQIDYSQLAVAAHASGQINIATQLLDYERDPGKQVPLLLDMDQPQLALAKAIESGEKDLGTLKFHNPPPRQHD
jgi:hypothetical protein